MDFDILNVLDILDVFRRNIKGAARRVHLRETYEIVIKGASTLLIWSNRVGEASANSLLAVHIQLTESTIDAFGLPNVILFVMNCPTRNRHTTRNERIFAVSGFITHVMSILTAIGFGEVDSCRQRVGALAENHLDVARHGAVYGPHGLLGLRNRLEGSIFCSLIRIISTRRYIERSLNSSISNCCA